MQTRKRQVGRTPISETPLRIQASGVSLTPDLRERTQRSVRRRLARFGTLIGRVDVRIEDVNGPRGGVDTVARIRLSVAGRPPVFVDGRALDPERALSRALSSMSAAMRRTTERLRPRTPAPTRVAVRLASSRRRARSGR